MPDLVIWLACVCSRPGMGHVTRRHRDRDRASTSVSISRARLGAITRSIPHRFITQPVDPPAPQMPSSTSATLSASAHVRSSSSDDDKPLKCAYITFLLTSPSYLPGILVLAHTIRHPTTSPHPGSSYPLIVAVNPALPQECIAALEEAGVEVRVVQPLVPVGEVTIIAERFVDTWTKLRVWEFDEFDVSLLFFLLWVLAVWVIRDGG